MRRYGYDYKFSGIIEVVIFPELLLLPFIGAFNPNFGSSIIISLFLLMFVYGLFAILAEMLPKTSLYLSLLFATGLYITAICNTVKYAFNDLFYYNIGVQTLYYSAIALATIFINRKEIALSRTPK